MIPLQFETLIKTALLEDLGRAGDLTATAIIDPAATATVTLAARDEGVVAGLACARLAWSLIDPRIEMAVSVRDGSRVLPGQTIATVTGPTLGLLTGERVALNFVGHLSGIASATRRIAGAIAHTKAQICDTRKTIPGLRALQKEAVRLGGGANHRFGLDDAVLIKDNHIAAAGGLTAAVTAAQARIGHLVKIEVEVDSLTQLEELLPLKVDAVLLDNFSPAELRDAVDLVAKRMITEASGRITAETVVPIAEAGVDLISSGALTHSVIALDVGLDWA